VSYLFSLNRRKPQIAQISQKNIRRLTWIYTDWVKNTEGTENPQKL